MSVKITKEDVIQILKDRGHSVVYDVSFSVDESETEIEAIVSVAQAIAEKVYLEGFVTNQLKRCETCGYLENEHIIKRMTSAAYWLIEGGEFASWLEDKSMPLAAAKEFWEFEEIYREMNDNDQIHHP